MYLCNPALLSTKVFLKLNLMLFLCLAIKSFGLVIEILWFTKDMSYKEGV